MSKIQRKIYLKNTVDKVNMVLNVHRNHKAYRDGEKGVERGMEVGEEADGSGKINYIS